MSEEYTDINENNKIIKTTINEVVRVQLENIMQANEEIDIAATNMLDQFGFDKAHFKKLAKLKFKENKDIEQAKANTVFSLYDELGL